MEGERVCKRAMGSSAPAFLRGVQVGCWVREVNQRSSGSSGSPHSIRCVCSRGLENLRPIRLDAGRGGRVRGAGQEKAPENNAREHIPHIPGVSTLPGISTFPGVSTFLVSPLLLVSHIVWCDQQRPVPW